MKDEAPMARRPIRIAINHLFDFKNRCMVKYKRYLVRSDVEVRLSIGSGREWFSSFAVKPYPQKASLIGLADSGDAQLCGASCNTGRTAYFQQKNNYFTTGIRRSRKSEYLRFLSPYPWCVSQRDILIRTDK